MKLPAPIRPTLLAIFAALAVGTAGCASTKSGGAPMSKEEVLQHEDVKGKPSTDFNHPIAKVHESALRALTAVGAEVKQNEPYHVVGRRPNKFGLFVGSGGETVEIFLYPKSDTETSVWFDTDMSFVGIAGQQGWNDQLKQELTTLLAQ